LKLLQGSISEQEVTAHLLPGIFCYSQGRGGKKKPRDKTKLESPFVRL